VRGKRALRTRCSSRLTTTSFVVSSVRVVWKSVGHRQRDVVAVSYEQCVVAVGVGGECAIRNRSNAVVAFPREKFKRPTTAVGDAGANRVGQLGDDGRKRWESTRRVAGVCSVAVPQLDQELERFLNHSAVDTDSVSDPPSWLDKGRKCRLQPALHAHEKEIVLKCVSVLCDVLDLQME
jgi:hypothetical protein